MHRVQEEHVSHLCAALRVSFKTMMCLGHDLPSGVPRGLLRPGHWQHGPYVPALCRQLCRLPLAGLLHQVQQRHVPHGGLHVRRGLPRRLLWEEPFGWLAGGPHVPELRGRLPHVREPLLLHEMRLGRWEPILDIV